MSFTREHWSESVEAMLASYDHPEMAKLPEDYHFANLTRIYGELVVPESETAGGLPVKSPEEQFMEQGALIATLFWKLAQARGFVGQPVFDAAGVHDSVGGVE